jgi:hypothetical protein
MRYAIIDTTTNKVVNVIEYATAPSSPPPGFGAGIIAVQSDVVGPDWTWNGTVLVAPPPPPAPPPAPQTVLPQDLVAQFTSTDITAITTAVSGNAAFAVLWYGLLAQKDPMIVSNARFQQGWAALVQVLGAARMSAIATALNITP